MKIRGERECQQCGTRWSYYERGTVECPDCGSLRSVGIDGRTAHTDATTTLDLSVHRTRFGEASGTLPDEGVDELKTNLREYTRKRGFIRGGELLPLDGTYLAARELLEAVDCYDRLRDPTDADRKYLLDLLAGVESGDRPETEHVPESLREARGMAAVHAVDEYRTDLLAFLDELGTGTNGKTPIENDDTGETVSNDDTDEATRSVSVTGADAASRIEPARDVLERLRDRTKRVEALNGDVPPADADTLVDVANAIGEYVRTGDETARDLAHQRLTNQP